MPETRLVSIRWLLAGLVAGVALPLLIILMWLYGSQMQRERKDARELAFRVAVATGKGIEQLNDDSRSLLERMAERPSIRDLRAPCDSLFGIVDFFPQYADLVLYDSNGVIRCSASPRDEDASVSVAARRWIESELRAGSLRAGHPLMRSIGDRWVSILSAPVTSLDGNSHGTLVLIALPEVVGRESLPKGSVVMILDGAGTVIARTPGGEPWNGRSARGRKVIEVTLQKKEGMAEGRGIDGVARQFGFVYLPDAGWYVNAGVPTAFVMEPVRQMFFRGLEVGIIILLLLIIVGGIFSWRIERPIALLVGAAEQRKLDDERKLKALSDRLLVIQEEERSRIARELHDDLGQSLTALKMDVIGLLKRSGEETPLGDRILRTIDATVTAVQRLSSELRPSILDDLGLIAALESEARLFEERTGIECELSLPGDAQIEPHTATAIYRILQEALTNVARHSNATRVEIRLRRRPNEILLEIRDDGRGVTSDELRDPASLGLMGIRERAGLVGGTVHFEGIEGRGTIVSVRIPSES